MKRLNTYISLYFNLSRKESKGLLVLFLLALLGMSVPPILKYGTIPSKNLETSDQETIALLMQQLEAESISFKPLQKPKYEKAKKIKYTAFNPNTADKATLLQNGIPGYLADRILKYRNAGGSFKENKDLLKIYGFQNKDYEKLTPYIRIPNQNYKKQPPAEVHKSKPFKIQPFDINEADLTQLITIKGIGAVRASRILQYRTKLGGFIDVKQLEEVYGLDSLSISQLYKTTFVKPSFQPNQIQLNQCSYEDLHRHPYISKKLAYLILQFRNQHGPFKTIDSIMKIKSFDKKDFNLLKPYLKVK